MEASMVKTILRRLIQGWIDLYDNFDLWITYMELDSNEYKYCQYFWALLNSTNN